MSLVFIGMPVYNGEKYIKNSLDSLVNQAFSDWELLISDNASEDNTAAICKRYCDKDKRIKYFLQKTNMGALFNFRYLLENSESKYFMWAAADDEWDSSFIDACLKGLESSEDIGLAFTNIVNIDAFGRINRKYPSFKKFINDDPYALISNYILDPECLGKANLIYGIYKIKKLKAFMIDFFSSQESNYCASDMALNLGILCRVGLSIDERVLFRKRNVQSTDNEKSINYYSFPETPILSSMKGYKFQLYKKVALAASAGTKYEKLVFTLMEYRERLFKEIQAYDFLANRRKLNLLKSALKTVLPNSLINFIKKQKK